MLSYWTELQKVLAQGTDDYRASRRQRSLTIRAVRSDALPEPAPTLGPLRLNGPHVHIDARAPWLYEVKDWEVTGVDWAVQGVLAAQSCTPNLIYEIVRGVETSNLDEYTIVCDGATHRSPAFALFSLMLVYHDGIFEASSSRVARACARVGLWQA